MNTKFNVYYSLSPTGPWTLANNTPIDKVEGLQSYVITGLNQNTTYYVTVVGGTVDNQNNFLPYISQPLGPLPEGAADVGVLPGIPLSVTTFAPTLNNTGILGQEFTATLP